MYFLVYIIDARESVVVSAKWIKDISKHIEKFINHGLNRNQEFTVFWTNRVDAYDENGLPEPSFKPNFNPTPFKPTFPEEGIYGGYLRSFRSKLICYLVCYSFDFSSSFVIENSTTKSLIGIILKFHSGL